MLRSMTSTQFQEWRIYDSLDPFGRERGDKLAASVVQALWNIARNRDVHRDPFPLTDFQLFFGDAHPPESTAPPPVKQTVEQQEFLLNSWIIGNNLAWAAEKKKVA